MTNYREIIRLKSQGYSERNIALSCGASRNTVSKACKAAAEQNVTWPLNETMTDAVLENMTFQIDTDWKLGLIGRNGSGLQIGSGSGCVGDPLRRNSAEILKIQLVEMSYHRKSLP